MLIVGFGRKVIETFEFGDSSVELEVGFFPLFFFIFLFIIIVTVADNFVNWSLFVSQESAGNSRGMYELDYDLDPKPNTNPKTGYIYTPTPQGWLIVVCVCVLLMFPFLIFVLL